MQEVTSRIESAEEIADIKSIMKTKIGAPFCTNVLRIALNMKEEAIASTIVAIYNINLDERMIIRAIKTNQVNFLYFVYSRNKNYERLITMDADNMSDDTSDMSEDDEDYTAKVREKYDGKYRTYTFDFLFKKVLEFLPDNYVPFIRIVAAWGLESSENIPMSLLINRQDVIAADSRIIKHYQLDCNSMLMVFAIRNHNEYFLKYALQQGLFSVDYFAETTVINEILDQLNSKIQTEFILNILIFADFGRWKQKQIRNFIELI